MKIHFKLRPKRLSGLLDKSNQFFFYIKVSLFLHLYIHVNSVHIHIFVTCFSYRKRHLNHVHFILYLGCKVQWLTFPWCTLLCGFISAINKLHKLKAMASCSLLNISNNSNFFLIYLYRYSNTVIYFFK